MTNLCPNCTKELNNENDYLITDESKLFKGHNAYIMCKNCGYVMIYNKTRDLIYNLDAYKDDEDVLKEIEELINNIDNRYQLEVVEKPKEELEVHHSCEGSCSSCKEQCSIDEPIQQMLLAYNKESGEFQLVTEDKLHLIDVDVNDFFLLEPVVVEKVVTYKIQKL